MKARADALFYGGKIYTMEAPDICKDAVVLKDGKFAYVGTKEEALEIFRKAEENGFVHQITNIDGEQKIFGI